MLARAGFHLFANPRAARAAPYGADGREAILSLAAFADAKREITSWPGYAPTPLRRLSKLAARAGIGDILYKDEAGRFGIGSFKALGGAYAVFRLLRQEIAARRQSRPRRARPDFRAAMPISPRASRSTCAPPTAIMAARWPGAPAPSAAAASSTCHADRERGPLSRHRRLRRGSQARRREPLTMRSGAPARMPRRRAGTTSPTRRTRATPTSRAT